MGITKREVADQLGVAKQTVVNYIDKLGLAPEHVTRVGKTDLLDDFAVSALADALGKNVVPRATTSVQEDELPEVQDSVIAALNGRIADLKQQNDRLVAELAEMRSSRERELAEMLMRREELAASEVPVRHRFATTSADTASFATAGGFVFGQALGEVEHVAPVVLERTAASLL